MGIFEYFSLLVQAQFPQELFRVWIKINDPPETSADGEPLAFSFNPENVLTHTIFMAVFGPPLLFLVIWGVIHISVRPGGVHGVMRALESPLTLLFLFGGVVVFLFNLRAVIRFKKNLNQFLSDFDELKELFGAGIKPTADEMPSVIDQRMVSFAGYILELESGMRSRSTEDMLGVTRFQMQRVMRIVRKFGFTTKPWEEYFEQAREGLKELIPA